LREKRNVAGQASNRGWVFQERVPMNKINESSNKGGKNMKKKAVGAPHHTSILSEGLGGRWPLEDPKSGQ